MIEDIKIQKTNEPVKEGFRLSNLKKFNVIIGENGVGKTKLFEQIEKDYEKENDIIIYVRANEVVLKDALKDTDSSLFVKSLIKVIKRAGVSITIPNNIKETVKRIESDINIFLDTVDIAIQGSLLSEKDIESKIIARTLLDTTLKEQEHIRKPEDLAQGHQRLFLASLLKACGENLKNEKENSTNILLLFEEPEIYLHPLLKRKLNKILKEISKNIQVIISTHDPYFFWSNLDDEETSIYKLEKDEDGNTKVSEGENSLGIEDEMLFLSLLRKVVNKLNEKGTTHNWGHGMENFSNYIKERYSLNNTKNWKYGGNTYNVLLFIYIRNSIHHPENSVNTTYTDEELQEGVQQLLKILNQVQ